MTDESNPKGNKVPHYVIDVPLGCQIISLRFHNANPASTYQVRVITRHSDGKVQATSSRQRSSGRTHFVDRKSDRKSTSSASISHVLDKVTEAFLRDLQDLGPFVWTDFYNIAKKHMLASESVYPYGSCASQKIVQNLPVLMGKYRLFSTNNFDHMKRWRTYMRVVDVTEWPTSTPTVVESPDSLCLRGESVVGHIISHLNLCAARKVANMGFVSASELIVHVSSFGMIWISGSDMGKVEDAILRFSSAQIITIEGIPFILESDTRGRFALMECPAINH